LPRRGAEHDSQMVRSGPRPGLLYPGRAPALPPLRSRGLPRPLGARWEAEGGPARPPRRRRRQGARARPRQPGVRGVHRPRGGERRRGARGDLRGEARPRAPRRDDAARRRRDPRRDVQRPGRRAGEDPGDDGRRPGVRRQAVRPAAADRPDEGDRTGLTGWDRQAERWIVHHRWPPLNDLFVWLTKIGSHGFVWLVLGLALSLAWRRLMPFALVLLAVAAADGIAGLVKAAVGENRPSEPDPLVTIPHSHSFPSGHTATAVAGAVVLSSLVPRAAPAFVLLAAAIAF